MLESGEGGRGEIKCYIAENAMFEIRYVISYVTLRIVVIETRIVFTSRESKTRNSLLASALPRLEELSSRRKEKKKKPPAARAVPFRVFGKTGFFPRIFPSSRVTAPTAIPGEFSGGYIRESRNLFIFGFNGQSVRAVIRESAASSLTIYGDILSLQRAES